MADPGRGAGERGAWRAWRERLEAIGFRPSRRLGQNFLLDENLARALVRDAGVQAGDFVLEVGPGLGCLTRPLLEAGARVLAVEIDARLLELLRESLDGREGFEALHADALAGKHELAPALRERLPAAGPWRLVANLPYSISAPLLAVLSELPNPPTAMSVLVQLEVAQRLCALPGNADWGPLSARLQAAYQARLGRRVGAAQFWPRPQVESAVVHLERCAGAPSRADLARLSGLVAALFQRRRQKLGRVLGELLGDRERARELLESLGLDPALRAETLGLEALLALARSSTWADRP
jgi:16S rRNA (adenine1518-N6/adenine1519-N6)-dimethyltransferase